MEQRNFREIIPGVSDILTLRQPTARGERAANGVFDPIKARPLGLRSTNGGGEGNTPQEHNGIETRNSGVEKTG
jgi:hypothetical protein